jgi:Tfp pilus assembly protein PilX
VVLFLALIALVAMSLAAIALVRSVDTSTMIAGNLAFKQAATTSGDSGSEAAIVWLADTANNNAASDPWALASHPFNVDNPSAGYYSSINPTLDLFAATTWSVTNSAAGTGANYNADGTDANTGNTVRYIIQRMCRNANQVLSETDCLFSDTSEDNRSKRVLTATEGGAGSATVAGSPIYRITARVVGPKNTVSYIQAYAY